MTAVHRRDFLRQSRRARRASMLPASVLEAQAPGFRLVDATASASLQFRHNSGAYGGKLLPETMGSGCAFIDYDGDGWQDVLLRQRHGLAWA